MPKQLTGITAVLCPNYGRRPCYIQWLKYPSKGNKETIALEFMTAPRGRLLNLKGRIKKIMQTDEEVGKVAQAVPVIIYILSNCP
ncbi:hypothetical protein C0J52_15634 [Blattella germanica]|nr:hypothetical protein C0J52_15634 [Blattella germanica]